MVDLNQYEQQLAERRSLLEQVEKQVQQTKFTPQISQRTLSGLTSISQQPKLQQSLSQSQTQFETQKAQQLKDIGKELTQQTSYESDFAKAKSQFMEEQVVQDIANRALRGEPIPSGYSRDVYQKVMDIQRQVSGAVGGNQKDILQAQKQLADLKSQGYSPVYSEKGLTGFTTPQGKSVSLQSLQASIASTYPTYPVSSQNVRQTDLQETIQSLTQIKPGMTKGEFESAANIYKQDIARQLANLPTKEEFAPNILTKAPTAQEAYKQYITDRNPVTSTVEYVVQKLGGRLSEYETKYQGRGQQLFAGGTGESVKGIIQTAPYFIPVVGQAYTIASGVGQFTKGGRTEAINIGKDLETRYNIPSIIGSGATLGIAALTLKYGVSGIVPIVLKAEKLLGYPKYTTKFLARNVEVIPAQGIEEGVEATGGMIISKQIAKTTAERLFEMRQYLSASTSKIVFKEGEEGVSVFAGKTIGRFKEAKMITPDKIVYGKLKKFAGVEAGEIKEQPLSVLINKKPIEVRRTFEDSFKVKSIGQVTTSGRKPESFVSVGAGTRLSESKTFLMSSSKLIKKGKIKQYGTQKSAGIITTKKPEEVITLYHGTETDSAKKIISGGLIPAKKLGKGTLGEVYLTPSKEAAQGYANRIVYGKGIPKPGIKPVVLESKIPKGEVQELLIRRVKGVGGQEEVVLKNVPAKYFGGQTLVQPKSISKSISKSKIFEAVSEKAIKTTIERAVSQKEVLLIKEEAAGIQRRVLIGKISSTLIPKYRVEELTTIGPEEMDVTKTIQIPLQPSRVKTDFGLMSGTLVDSESLTVMRSKIITPSLTEDITQFRMFQPYSYKQPSALKQAQRTRQVTIPQQKQPTPIPTKPRIDVPTPIIMFPKMRKGISYPKTTTQKKAKQAYITEIRRFGKFKVISKPTTKGRALLTGARKTVGTLAATFRIRPIQGTTTESEISYAPSMKVFRTPKGKSENQFTFIQRSGVKEGGIPTGRLTTISERREIQLARRRTNYL